MDGVAFGKAFQSEPILRSEAVRLLGISSHSLRVPRTKSATHRRPSEVEYAPAALDFWIQQTRGRHLGSIA